ncbi:MAG TPA: phage tail protein [Acidimicrobiales bacterium]|nr:phage tail protein [Acidimicrobiales bacterium]
MSSDPDFDTVLSVYFSLVIDSWDLGMFITCSGLGMDMGVTTIEEGGGGMNVFPRRGRVKYPNLQVTRPIGPDTHKTMAWLQASVNATSLSTAELTALSPSMTPIFTWQLSGVLPAKWTGPSFDAGNPQQATETLELAYGAIMLGQA